MKTTLGMVLEDLDGLELGLDDGLLVSSPYQMREDFAGELCRYVRFKWCAGPVLGVLEFDGLRFEVVPVGEQTERVCEGGYWTWQ